MISLIITPRDKTSRVNKMLSDWYGTACNIKSDIYCIVNEENEEGKGEEIGWATRRMRSGFRLDFCFVVTESRRFVFFVCT